MWALVLQVLLAVVVVVALLVRKRYRYWSSRGVSGPRAIFPFGYTWDRAQNDPFILETKWLGEYGKVYGVYSGLTPTLIIAEPEYIRQVMIKDFASFANRRILNSYHPVWNRNLFSVDYDDWKIYRGMTTPAFSSGKLRAMNLVVRDCNRKLISKIESLFLVDNGIITPKELFTNYSIDITSAVFFATETDAHSVDPVSGQQNAIVRQCLALVDIPSLKSAIVGSLPRPFLNVLGITSAFREGPLAYVCDLLRSMVAQQRKLPVERQNEFVRLLLQTENDSTAAKKDFRVLTDDEIIAQCLVYFSASLEQIASHLSYIAYELALDQKMQSRLLDELQKIKESIESEGENDFEQKVYEAVYLEAIVKEALRKYPPELRMDRRVSSETGATIGDLHLEKDTLIEIPTIAVHYNPDYWPDPWKFDPERFMPANRESIIPYTFIPFGLGPRNCIGMRFAYQVAKSCMANLVLKYKFEPVSEEKTPSKGLSFTAGNQSLLIPWFEVRLTKRSS